MSPTTFAWLVLLCPLVGTATIGLGFRVLRGRAAGWLGTLAIAGSFVFSVLAFIALERRAPEHRQVTSTLWDYAVTTGLDAKVSVLVDPLSVFMVLVVSGVSTLIH